MLKASNDKNEQHLNSTFSQKLGYSSNQKSSKPLINLLLVACQNGKDAFTWSSVNNCTKRFNQTKLHTTWFSSMGGMN